MKKLVLIILGLICGIIFYKLDLFINDVDLGIELARKGDFSKASELYKKACDDKIAEGCALLGYLYFKGEGIKQDYFKANEFYKKACDGGIADGCNNLGVSYYKGQGLEQNNQKAKELFGKACDLGDKIGCSNYKEMNK